MTVTVTSPITGAAQTGFTSPTFTLTSDVAPSPSGKQVAVTALGGTQTGASVHSVASPFTLTFTRPATLKTPNVPNPVTGVVAPNGSNEYKLITRKGAVPLAGQAARIVNITTSIDVPTGVDLASPAEVRAALSAHIGYLTQVSAGIGDTATSGLM